MTAEGGSGANGIGNGANGSGGSVAINGGIVTAIGGEGATDIAGAQDADSSAGSDTGTPYLDANRQMQTTPTPATPVTANVVTWTSGWYVVNDPIEINRRVTVTGDVYLILADGCDLSINGGIEVSGNNSLTIYAQSTGMRWANWRPQAA